MATLQSGKCFTVPTFFGMCCRSEWQERMYIYKLHEVDQTKHEIFCVHIVCNEIQVEVNLEITTFFFYLRFPYCPNFFRIWGCNMVVITARKGWPDTATLASGQIHSTQGQRVESSWSRWSHWMDLEGLRRPVGRAIYHYFQPLAITVCCLHLLQVSDDHPSSKENHSELPEWLSSSCSNPYQHQMFWETHTLTSKLSSLPTSIKTILLTEQTDRQKMQSSKLSTLHLHMWMTETLM